MNPTQVSFYPYVIMKCYVSRKGANTHKTKLLLLFLSLLNCLLTEICTKHLEKDSRVNKNVRNMRLTVFVYHTHIHLHAVVIFDSVP